MTHNDQGNGQPLTDRQRQELAILLLEFLKAETFFSKQRLVEGNPILLSNEADLALAGLILQYEDDDPVQRSLEVHRKLLNRCREIGIREAFLELRQTIQDRPFESPLDEEALQMLVDVIGEFITAENWVTSKRLLDEHPELLTPEADAVFDELIRTHQKRNQPGVVRSLMIHRDLLRACREMGVEAAFERMINPPEALDIIAENTIAVLTDLRGERRNWLETINLSRVRAAETGDQPMLALLQAISRLLNGEDPDAIAPQLEGAHADCWQRIVRAMSGSN